MPKKTRPQIIIPRSTYKGKLRNPKPEEENIHEYTTIPTMHQSHIPQCMTLWQKCAHMCTLQNGALWDIFGCIVGFVRWDYCFESPMQIEHTSLRKQMKNISEFHHIILRCLNKVTDNRHTTYSKEFSSTIVSIGLVNCLAPNRHRANDDPLYWHKEQFCCSRMDFFNCKRMRLGQEDCQVNSLWSNDAIWRQRSGSTLAQVMACCLTAPSHHLNQCWFTISKIHWHSFEYNFTRDILATNH